MPYSIKAFTNNCDGFYNIFINSRHCHEQNVASIKHELRHIENHDFDKIVSVDELEKTRHLAINRRTIFT
jgi:cyclopropane fatty-acyl-phospholipid synthase-like methyltransferase